MDSNPAMLVMGDSVTWGQGLTDENKFYRLVFDQLSAKYPGLQEPVMLAHSGAIIGRGDTATWPVLPGEIPVSGPTIFHQCDQYADPSSVRVILMDGGINDIDLRVILNPATQPSDLSDRIKKYCYTDMLALLQKVATRFSDPQCRIIVLGYYPILGEDSDQESIPALLEARGVPNAELLTLGSPAITDPRELAVRFWHESDQNLKAAVAAAGDRRITYILPPFEEENALFESNPWLWGLDFGEGLEPEDEVADLRRDQCVLRVPGLVDRQVCIRASVGHPNAVGAIKYYEAVMSAFA